MAQLSIFLLGGFEVNQGDALITGFESTKVRALLAYLAAEADRPHRRETLATLLWPDWPQQSAMSNLRYALADLRKNIGDRDAQPPFLLITRESIQLNRESDIRVDVGELESAIINQQSETYNLKSAISLYRGEFLEGFSLPDSPAFEQWVLARREGLQRQALQALSALAEACEQQGDLESALPYARRQVELEPWHEPGQHQLMRLLALSGQRSAALGQYEACRQALADELKVEPSAETKRLYEAIRDEDIQGIRERGTGISPAPYPLTSAVLPPAPGEAPFKGLQYFDVDDADLFFGREALTARLVGHIREMMDAGEGGVRAGLSPVPNSYDPENIDLPLQDGCCFLAVVGASGSGKSSVVRAGVVPALQKGEPLADGTLPPEGSPGWHIHVFTPTAHPLEALAISLMRETHSVSDTAKLMDDLAGEPRSLHLYAQHLLAPVSPGLKGKCRLLLVVDQFEELFTLCRSNTERTAFLDNLLTAVQGGGPTQVIVVLRADFYGHCAQYPLLRQALCTRQEYIGPMEAGELRRAIEEPARQNGWEFEAGLVDLILRDTGEEPGALPLLEHALLETWQRRSGHTLTHRGYMDAGGVHGAIARTAESVFAKFNTEQQALARRIFLRLTELGEGTQDTRRRAPLDELSPTTGEAPKVTNLLKILADARLITLSEDTAEVAHEALIREWPALRQWLSEDREGLHLHRHLTESAEAWAELERDEGELYRGARLAQALEWAEGHVQDLNALEREYLQASQAHAEGEAAEREAQRQRELEAAQRLVRTQRQRSLVLSVGLAIAVVLIGVALWLNSRANTSLGHAKDAQQTAQAEALIRATQQSLAEQARGTAQAEALGRATQQSLAEQARGTAQAEAFNRATQEAIAIQQAELANEQSLLSRSRELAAAAVSSLSQDPQLSLLLALEAYATANTDGAEAALHQAVQASHLQKILSSDPAALDSSGALVSLAYSPDGSLLAVVNDQDWLQVFNTLTGGLVYTYKLDDELQALEEQGSNFRYGMRMEVEFFPDGKLCLEGSNWFVILDGSSGQEQMRATAGGKIVQIFDRISGQEIFHFEHTSEGNMPIYAESTPAGLHILVYSQNTSNAIGELTAYQLPSGQQVIKRTWERGSGSYYTVNRIEYSPDGARLALQQGDVIEIWDLATDQLINRLTEAPSDATMEVAFSPDGARLAVRDAANSLKIWQIDTGNEVLYTTAASFFFLPDSKRLIVTDVNKQVSVWSLETRRVLYDFLCNPSQTVITLIPDGSQLAAGSDDGAVYLCEVSPDYELRQWVSEDLVLNYAYAPGPSLLGIASVDNVIRLYDAETGALFTSLGTPPNSSLRQFDISADGARIATLDENIAAGTDPTYYIHIWETATGKEVARTNNIGWAGTLRFDLSPDGNRMLDILSGVFADEYSTYDFSMSTGTFWLDWMPFAASGYDADGSRLALAKMDGRVSVLETVNYTRVMTATLANEPVVLAFYPDGSRLAVGTVQGDGMILEVLTGQIIFSLPRQATALNALAYSPDGSLFATGNSDGSVQVWDGATGVKQLDLIRHESAINFLAFNAAGDQLISASQDGVARVSLIQTADILALAQQRLKRSFTPQELQDYRISSPASFQPAADEFAHESPAPRPISLPAIPKPDLPAPQPPSQAGQKITVENASQLIELGWGFIGDGQSKAVSPDGRYIASPSALALSLYDLKTLRPVWENQVDFYVIQGVSFSPDGSLMAAGGDSGDVHLMRTEDGVEVNVLKGHSKAIRDVKFSPDGKLLASCAFDDLILLWQMPDGALVGRLANQPYAKGVLSIDFSPDGAWLASGSMDGKVRIWDIARQVMIREFVAGEWGANVDFSPDGTTLVMGDWSETVGSYVWRVADGAALFPLQTPAIPPFSGGVPFYSPDGSMIVMYAYQYGENNLGVSEFYFLNAQDGALISSYQTKVFGCYTAGFTPDSRLFYFVTWDGLLHLWGVP